MPTAGGPCAEEIRDLSRRRVEIFGGAGEAWRFAASLKSISEDTAQEYEGRAVLELIQNGHDALGDGSIGRIHLLLDIAGDVPTLYVANDGMPFSSANFLAIVGFGLSDKGAGEGIGNKGLGFRSVLQLTDHPEVFSRDPDNPADRRFSGYSFRFPTDEELVALAEDQELGERLVLEVSALDLPVPADVEDPEVLRFATEGFATVIKLPLRDTAAVEDVQRQINDLASDEAPVLLFLDRVTSMQLVVQLVDGNGEQVVLTRSDAPTTLVAEHHSVLEVDLGSQGRYLLARRLTKASDFREAVRRSAAARQVDRRWLDWEGEAWVGVALRLDQPIGAGIIYTFLPMQEPSPLAAHVHAPFFTKLARREVSLDVPLNDYLMGEIAAACLELSRTLREEGNHQTVVPYVVDLVAWEPPLHRYLERACADQDSKLQSERFVPIAGRPEWSSLDDTYAWPQRLRTLSVISAKTVAALHHSILDPEIGAERQGRMAKLHQAVLDSGMEPSNETMAGWAEGIAASLKSRSVGFEDWALFYDELATAFDGASAPALRGRRLILDQDSNLRQAMGAEKEGRRSPVLFFAPSVDEEGTEAANAARLPKPLANRIVYTHGSIPWVTEPGRRRRNGRIFLEASGLVREYRTDRLLELLRDVMSVRPSRNVQIAALEYGCALYPNLNEAQRTALVDIPFAVPTAQGQWLFAQSLAFSRAWGTVGGALLDRLIGFANEETPELSAMRERVTADPADWPAKIDDRDRWEDFLRTIGVHDGLPLIRTRLEGGDGNQIRPELLGEELGLHSSVHSSWVQDVRSVWGGGTNPYTRYRFGALMAALPGAGEIERLGSDARETYAELIGLGLAAWSKDVFEVTVWRPERRVDQQDIHRWPTPVTSYLRNFPWISIEGGDDENQRTFARPMEAWVPLGTQLPRFVPAVVQPLPSVVGLFAVLDRLRILGIRIWGEPRYCGDVLRSLPELLDRGYVTSQHAASFKKQCRQAWDHLLGDPAMWPWSADEVATVVVTEGMQVKSVHLGSGTTVLVPDEADQTKQALFGLTAQPVLVADPTHGQALSVLMSEQLLDVLPTSEISVEVYGDDRLVVPDPELPPLVTEDRQWIATVVALVAELKSGPFTHSTEQSIRQILERLRMIRYVRVESLRLALGGEDIEPPAQTTSLPIEHTSGPTIVGWAGDVAVFEELVQCSSSIAFLIGQPQLADVLQLVFSRLGQACLSPLTAVTDEILSQALQVSEEQVRESRADLRGSFFDVLDRLRLLLMYFGGSEELDIFDLKVRDTTDEAAITSVLETWSEILPLPPTEVVQFCRSHAGLADLRDALGLDFVRFNRALSDVEPPHPPLRHPDRHERAMDRFVEAHKGGILDRLRLAYVNLALKGGDLDAYGQGRSHEGLFADPEWLDHFAEPPEDVIAQRVGTWLAEHGANPDLNVTGELPDVSELRTRNFDSLDQVVRDAELRLRAWCRQHAQTVPLGWNSPMSEARSALEASYLSDFFDLSIDQILAVIVAALGWPAEMQRTLDLEVLGLDPSELVSRDQADADDRRRRQHERSHLHMDGQEVSVDIEHLGNLADSIAAGITEELLEQSGKVVLAQIPSRSDARRGNLGGRGLTMARSPGMSEEQRIGVGLVGEVVARAWLERHYGDVEWVSGYRNIVLGDSEGSDSLGYDFRTRGRSKGSLYFEVKALVGEALELAEFELGETEVIAAQRHRDSYRILLICSALESESRQILELPNPLARRGAGRYTLLGRGLRYRCAFDR